MDRHPNIKVDHAIAEAEARLAALRQEISLLADEVNELRVARRVNQRLYGPIPDDSLVSVSTANDMVEKKSTGAATQNKRLTPTIGDRIESLIESRGPMRTQKIWEYLREETPDISFRTVVGTLQRSKGQGRFQLNGRDWQKA